MKASITVTGTWDEIARIVDVMKVLQSPLTEASDAAPVTAEILQKSSSETEQTETAASPYTPEGAAKLMANHDKPKRGRGRPKKVWVAAEPQPPIDLPADPPSSLELEPEKVPEITNETMFDRVQAFCAAHKNLNPQIAKILQDSYGVQAISKLPQEVRAEFLAAMEALPAQMSRAAEGNGQSDMDAWT